MAKVPKTFTLNLKRVIAGPPAKVFDVWLDPKRPCNPWGSTKTLGLEQKLDSLYCILSGGVAYVFGRVVKLAKGKRIQFTWMSPYTHGQETMVTVHFKKHPEGTLMTLRHTDLPNDKDGRLHTEGWNQFLGKLEAYFAGKK